MSRIAAHLEVAGLIRLAQAEGGFAAVLRRGERDAGTILVVALQNGKNPRLFERFPSIDGSRRWTETRAQPSENPGDFEAYLARRAAQDGDLWLIELDVPNPQRLIDTTGTSV
ncbi:MAG TPA: DUF1491 family protein [Novosphingobium sp.]|nr:DUF1491 family protein [Novosphingobium sp.]